MINAHYDKNVFILGAGFSASAGAPLLNDFWGISGDFMKMPSGGFAPELKSLFQRVFDHRKRLVLSRDKINIDLDNIEELFGLVEMECEIGNQQSRTRMHEVRDSLLYLIIETLRLSTMGSRQGQIVTISEDQLKTIRTFFPNLRIFEPSSFGIYEYFVALISNKMKYETDIELNSDTIITFNYDLIIDQAINQLGLKANYGFHPNHEKKDSVCLLKLHGSANFEYCTNDVCNHLDVTSADNIKVMNLRKKECPKCHNKTLTPLIVPPTWNKSKYHLLLNKIWEKALQELKTATRIIIIGYSMPETDNFFKYLLAVALSENSHIKKVIVINCSEALKHKYKSFFDQHFINHGKFHYSQNYFETFMRNRSARKLLNRDYFKSMFESESYSPSYLGFRL